MLFSSDRAPTIPQTIFPETVTHSHIYGSLKMDARRVAISAEDALFTSSFSHLTADPILMCHDSLTLRQRNKNIQSWARAQRALVTSFHLITTRILMKISHAPFSLDPPFCERFQFKKHNNFKSSVVSALTIGMTMHIKRIFIISAIEY
jgi:hypothetical protein